MKYIDIRTNQEIALKQTQYSIFVKQEDDNLYFDFVKSLEEIELNELTNWFDNYFAKQLQQSQWQDDFTVAHDEYFDKDYTDFNELKVHAKIVRDRIREIKNILKIV